MSKHIAYLSVAAVLLGAAALPGAAAAADYYDGGDRPLAFHSRDDVYLDGGRARVEHRDDLRPAAGFGYRGAPGPVTFDGRDPYRHGRPFGYGEPNYRRPVAVERPAYGYGYDRPAAFIPHLDRPYGAEAGYGDGPVPAYRPAALPVGPAYGEGYGGADAGCTIEQAESTTPAGWRKIVTHRTCYRR